MDNVFTEHGLDFGTTKILVVDDQVINIRAVNALLSTDYTVVAATNGEDALKIAEEQLPDLILMDVVMPGMSGKEACMLLKANELTADIPVIFITTVTAEQDENECWESGGVDFIAKPFNPHTLKNRVRSQLELKYQKDILLKLAYSDGLTGVYNRRYFDEHFSKLRKLSHRQDSCLAMLLLDIDFFKNFNDEYGHVAGDDALRAVSKAISKSLDRPSDFVARYGGEEFVVVLPDTDITGAEHVAQKIMLAIKNLDILNASSEYGVLSVSIGAISLKGSDTTKLDMLELVDSCLYKAKETGRNRSVTYKSD